MARVGLPKSIIAKYGITKKAWQVFRGKKRGSNPASKPNPKGRTKTMARRRYFGRKRRRGRPKIPLEVGITALAIPFIPGYPGWATPISDLQAGKTTETLSALVHGFTGIDPTRGTFNLMATINPFDFDVARYTKMLIAAALISKVRKRFVKLDKVPFLGRYIS